MSSLEDVATQAQAQIQAAAPSLLAPMHAVDSKHSLGFRLTFTQGLLVGQLSIILLAIVFIRYFIFEDVNTALEKERLAVSSTNFATSWNKTDRHNHLHSSCGVLKRLWIGRQEDVRRTRAQMVCQAQI